MKIARRKMWFVNFWLNLLSKVRVTHEFCYKYLCMKHDCDPPPPLPSNLLPSWFGPHWGSCHCLIYRLSTNHTLLPLFVLYRSRALIMRVLAKWYPFLCDWQIAKWSKRYHILYQNNKNLKCLELQLSPLENIFPFCFRLTPFLWLPFSSACKSARNSLVQTLKFPFADSF